MQTTQITIITENSLTVLASIGLLMSKNRISARHLAMDRTSDELVKFTIGVEAEERKIDFFKRQVERLVEFRQIEVQSWA